MLETPQESYDTESQSAGWDSPERAQKLVEPYITSGATVLDIGIGTGQAIKGYADKGAIVIGIDHDEEMINEATLIVGENGSVRKGDINELIPVDDLKDSIDVAQAIGVLEFAKDLPDILGKVYETLKPGGVFVFTVELIENINAPEKEVYFPEAQVTVYRYLQKEIEALLQDSGFTLITSDSYDGYKRGDSPALYGMFLAQK